MSRSARIKVLFRDRSSRVARVFFSEAVIRLSRALNGGWFVTGVDDGQRAAERGLASVRMVVHCGGGLNRTKEGRLTGGSVGGQRRRAGVLCI